MGIISDEFDFMVGDEEYVAEGSLYDWCLKNGERGQLLIDEWNDEKNKNEFGMNTVMQELMIDSVKKYWWTCKSCGRDFLMAPGVRILQYGGCEKSWKNGMNDKTKQSRYCDNVIKSRTASIKVKTTIDNRAFL